MRSLFFRIFFSFWIAMTLIAAGSGLVHVAHSDDDRWTRWLSLHADAFRMRVREASAGVDSAEQAERALASVRQELERVGLELVVFAFTNEGEYVVPQRPTEDVPAPVHALATRVQRAAQGQSEIGERAAYFAEPLGPRQILVAELKRPSRLLFYIDPSTLPIRLAVILAVTGIVCYGLARQLTRRLRIIRDGSRRLAAGDLSVRVGPEFTDDDDEAGALARDLDRMAERIAALLGAQQRLLRDVSHELRSPLARLTVALELARQSGTPELGEYHDRIEREAERLGQLVGEILTLTRLEGEAKAEREALELDFSELVRQVTEDANIEAEPSHARVDLISREPIRLRGFAELLRRAVDNVVRNAVRFTPKNSKVEVRLERALVEGRLMAQLSVRDHGPGVPPHLLQEIFQPFFCVAPSRQRSLAGTGVGLAITERAIRLHGGSVLARNADNGGLVVSISLPLT